MSADSMTQYVIVTPTTAVGIQLVPQVSGGALKLNGTPADADKYTITIDAIAGFAYTFKTALTPTAGEVLIGASAATAIANLFNAMTGGPGSGTTYAAGTNPCANTTPASVLAINISGQPALFARSPDATNSIALYNGVGWAYTLALTVNTSGFLAKTDFAALTGNSKRAGKLHIVSIRPAGVVGLVQVYDSAQVTGAPVGNTLALVEATVNFSNYIDYTGRVQFANGLYAVETSAGSVGSIIATYE